jgi:hypothetical protein
MFRLITTSVTEDRRPKAPRNLLWQIAINRHGNPHASSNAEAGNPFLISLIFHQMD